MTRARAEISASILAADFWNLEKAVTEALESGVTRIHVDVMDGHFVPNLSIGVPLVQSLRKHVNSLIEVHLMVNNPAGMVDWFADAGANLVIVHVEASPHLHRMVQHLKSKELRAGVALNPSTPVALVSEILPFIDQVLVMTVNPGFAGQEFLPFVVRKVRQLNELRNRLSYDFEIAVDGGINPQTGPVARQAGADVFVAASAIFNKPSVAQAVRELRDALDASIEIAEPSS